MLIVNVQNVIKNEVVRNTLRMTVKTMNGDADGYNIKTLDIRESEFPEYELFVNRFIVLIKAYMKKKHNDRCDIDRDYGEFIREVLGNSLSEDEFDPFVDMLGELLPGDPTCDYQYQAAYKSHTFTWFDSEGIEYACEVSFK